MRYRIIALAFAWCLTLAASAYARPRVGVKLPTTINAGQATPFAWTAHVPSSSTVVVQRQEGAARAWRTMVRLGHAHGGSSNLPALPIGVYTVRIADVDRHGRTLAERRLRVAAFGEVNFSTLFRGGGNGGTYSSPTATFPYVFLFYNGAVNFTAFTVTANPCRSVHLNFIAGPPGGGEDEQIMHQHGTATIAQESADPVSSTAAGNTVARLDAQIVPGQTWALHLAQAQEGTLLFRWYVNGSAVCDRNTASMQSGE